MSPLEKRRQRVRDIRMRVAAVAASLFIVVFSGITVQLASGHDPALSKSSARTTTSTTVTPSTSTGSEESDDSGSTSQAQSNSLAPVTTSQS